MSALSVMLLSSEVAPYAKTGGLADVAAALSRDLGARGCDVKLFTPYYRKVREAVQTRPHGDLQDMRVALGPRTWSFSIQRMMLPSSEAEIWFADCPELFDREGIYGGPDEHVRFAAFTRASLECCRHLGWVPDVFHCNDWHTALLPLYLVAEYRALQPFESARTVLTIHNIAYQGEFPAHTIDELGLAPHASYLRRADLAGGRVNFLRTGLTYADYLTTVSETYAREIQTSEYGLGMEDLLRSRAGELVGIVNGIDASVWNPETDPLIPFRFSADALDGKQKSKQALLEDAGLPFDESVPLIGIVSRLTAQKGFELLAEVLPVILDERALQLSILGSGEPRYERFFQSVRDRYPDRVAFYAGYNEKLAHRIEAGADIFLMPSRYEPCGLNQMYSQRYGTIPIVRRTGGLADTVEHFDPATGRGTGFSFDAFETEALHRALSIALDTFADGETWDRLVQNAMAQDWSWGRRGAQYVELYERAKSG